MRVGARNHRTGGRRAVDRGRRGRRDVARLQLRGREPRAAFIPVARDDQDGDGVTDQVSIDIVRPQETDGGLKVPAIIDPSPYYTSLGRGNESQFIHTTPDVVLDRFPLYNDNFFVPRGYAFIAADAWSMRATW